MKIERTSRMSKGMKFTLLGTMLTVLTGTASSQAGDGVYYPGVSGHSFSNPVIAPEPIHVASPYGTPFVHGPSVHYPPVAIGSPVYVSPAVPVSSAVIVQRPVVVYEAPYYYPAPVSVISPSPVTIVSPGLTIPTQISTRHHRSLFGRYDSYRYEIRTPAGRHKYKFKVDHWDREVEYKYDFDD